MKVNIVLPFMSKNAVGGIKIMYQYADLLSERGHKINIYHTNILKNSPKKYLNIIKYLRNLFFKKNNYPNWYVFRNTVNCISVNCISNKTILDADILMSTMYATALDVYKLDKSKGKKINFIQDFEIWIGSLKEIEKSYILPIIHVVINDYLFNIVEKKSPIKPILIYNAIDNNIFNVKIPINRRNPKSICMMYSEEKRKGSIYGLKALINCKKVCPDLTVTFFSVFEKPIDLPNWINYYKSPNNLTDIYNSSAVFFSPSIGEGWALPPAESMSCGCALVCTDIAGHAAYAKAYDTALLVNSEDVSNMTEKLLEIIYNEKLRIHIAENGKEYIQKFTWRNSLDTLESLFKN